MQRKAMIERAGLSWDVVESIAVPEAIKTRTGDFRQKSRRTRSRSARRPAPASKVCCYNFMAITDWTRTDLDWPLQWRHGAPLRHDRLLRL